MIVYIFIGNGHLFSGIVNTYIFQFCNFISFTQPGYFSATSLISDFLFSSQKTYSSSWILGDKHIICLLSDYALLNNFFSFSQIPLLSFHSIFVLIHCSWMNKNWPQILSLGTELSLSKHTCYIH